MANNNRFTITDDSSWQVVADGESIGHTDITWETFNSIETELKALPAGSTVDLTGRYFGAGSLVDDGVTQRIIIEKDMDIIGGTFSATSGLTWTRSGSNLTGVFDTDPDSQFDLCIYPSSGLPGDLLPELLAFDGSEKPRLAVWPAPPENRKNYPATYNPNWFVIENEQGTTNGYPIDSSGNQIVSGGVQIHGFVITDATQRTEVATKLASLTTPLTDLVIRYRAGANLVASAKLASWDSGTGRLDFVEGGLTSTSYFQYAFTGAPEFIEEDGQYAIDYANKSFVYRTAGTGSNTRISSLGLIWDAVGNYAHTFTGTTFVGCTNNNGGPAQIKNAAGPRLVLNDCTLKYGTHGVRGNVDFYDTKVGPFIEYGATVTDGVTAERSFFYETEVFESLTLLPTLTNTGGGDPTPLEFSLIKDCFFTNPITVHGQGLSLYNCSWQNATVEHCLFLDCERAVSYQSRYHSGTSGARITPGTFTFKNNLTVFDNPRDVQPNGQASMSFNGSLGDEHLDDPNDRQVVNVHSNSIVYNPDNVDELSWYSPTKMDFARFKYSTLQVSNNFVGQINAGTENLVTYPDQIPQGRDNNLQHNPQYTEDLAWGPTDLDDEAGGQESVFGYETLATTGAASTGATDSGKLGFRWDNNITMNDVRNLPDNWHTLWPASSGIPAASSTPPGVYADDDRRS